MPQTHGSTYAQNGSAGSSYYTSSTRQSDADKTRQSQHRVAGYQPDNVLGSLATGSSTSSDRAKRVGSTIAQFDSTMNTYRR